MRYWPVIFLSFLLMPATAEGQLRDTTWLPPPPPVVPLPQPGEAAAPDAWARTTAALVGAAIGFRIAYAYQDDADHVAVPMVIGSLASATATSIFTDASPLRVFIGAALAAVPAGAIATFAAGSLEDEVPGFIPVFAFAIPHGLLTSAFAQAR